KDRQLVCELRQVSLGSTPDYDAISYAWNGEKPTVPVICNGRTLLLTPSLHEALYTLYRMGQLRAVWADAICIDQSNDSEKAIQVPLMGHYYTHAKRVLVWLGTSGLSTTLAMRAIPDLNRQLSRTPDSIVITNKSLLQHDLPRMEDPVWKGIGEVLARSWFRRLWIVQEV
ncbi:hypothetical protein BAUCODRAFT_46876, partial [Baudoinia panamericana UAMH 10762]